jgi:hypothetical protein
VQKEENACDKAKLNLHRQLPKSQQDEPAVSFASGYVVGALRHCFDRPPGRASRHHGHLPNALDQALIRGSSFPHSKSPLPVTAQQPPTKHTQTRYFLHPLPFLSLLPRGQLGFRTRNVVSSTASHILSAAIKTLSSYCSSAHTRLPSTVSVA